ncbi:hypothetical protein [uncultured Nostoc sp.]|uniref:hypothetical protein n=1 Tax=uncultured Nostoc sp. TaxID=340711 RepID=UPI0026095563|nr:hypothetical protein [uncultured Nostoc sp.]
MQVSKLKTIVNLSLNDILPALDIDGGVSSKPILGKTTIQSIIDLLSSTPGGGGNSSGAFSVPTTIKTVAANSDYFIGIDVDGLLYKISKADLLAGLTSSSSSGSGSGSGNTGTIISGYPAGMALLLEGGSLVDKSNNARDASPFGSNSPSLATGIDGKSVLRWNGSGTQELQIAPFLGNAVGATIYCVFTIYQADNYNLVRTFGLDDYWKFVSGSGYFRTFRNSRFDGYPASMPSTGSHLVSIHADFNTYEVMVDRISKGQQQSTFTPGDRFRIGTKDKLFTGDIATLLVYPEYISPNSTKDVAVKNTIKSNYPSLSFS